jgi:hypothetical protein
LFEKDYSGRNYSKVPTSYLTGRIDAFLEKHQDEILEMAATKLADKLARSKRGKEILENITN